MFRGSAKTSLALATLACLSIAVSGKKFLQYQPITKEDVDRTMAAELAGAADPGKLRDIEEKLRVVYGALPKNEHGRLNHQAVRYVLHRFFMQNFGWYVRGLEPNGLAQNPSAAKVPTLGDWVAGYLQDRFEERSQGGVDLRALATIAATLEDLVRKEASSELTEIYSILNHSATDRLPREQAEEVIKAYMMIYLANRNVSLSNPRETRRKMQIFEKNYNGWAEARNFLENVETRHLGMGNEAGVDFGTALDVVSDMSEHFGSFNDGECKDLKNVMRNMANDSGKLGRIRLPDFYNKSLYTHWKFTEKVEFLREVGALDESGTQTSVIIPNYISSFTNCLKATSLYAVCCRNECEDLYGKLEERIAAPTAKPATVAAIVETLSTDTVAAPRRLSAKLMQRLSQMSEANDGEVHLHGRLFAQWMHHAFPLECPYPHEAGTTSPQTAAEWMERTGNTAHHNEADMQKVVEDACSIDGNEAPANSHEEPELPWTEAEELLMAKSQKPSNSSLLSAVRIAVLIVAPLLTAGLWQVLERLSLPSDQKLTAKKVLGFSCTTVVLCALDLVDVSLFALIALAVVFLGAFRHLSATHLDAPKPDKCCV